MFKRLFGKQENEQEKIAAPVKGEVVPIDQVPDPAFAEKMIGEGFAIIPEEGRVVSPVQGEIIQLFPTNHAIGIRSERGLEILIHIGLDTVSLQGEGFTAHVQVGDQVQVGQALIDFSLDRIKSKGLNSITPIVITNPEKMDSFKIGNLGVTNTGEQVIMNIKVKE